MAVFSIFSDFILFLSHYSFRYVERLVVAASPAVRRSPALRHRARAPAL
jgi:hypothetical protein